MRRGPRGRIPEPPKGGTWYRSSNCSASPASFLSHGGTNTACGRERCNLHDGGSPGGEVGRGSSRGEVGRGSRGAACPRCDDLRAPAQVQLAPGRVADVEK